MRFALLAVAIVASGCGDDTTNNNPKDLSVGHADMATGGGDMTAKQRTGCAGLRTCINGCQGNATCFTNCQDNATTQAQMLQAAYVQCAFDDCNMPPDGGTIRCMNDTDTSADCNTCFSNSLHGGNTGLSCTPANDPNCGHCSVALKACLDNLP